jgi:hypothetical protein
MSTAIRIEVLPARLGDCLLVECHRKDGPPWRMLVDGGPPDTWPILEARLRKLGPDNRHLDVAVITHIDSDHIGGMIPFLLSDLARDVGDFWFNGRTHLPGASRTRSIDQGESVVAALLGSSNDLAGVGGVAAGSGGTALPWNEAFDRGPIDTGDEGGFIEVGVPDGPTITVLSPTTKRLTNLAAKWSEAIEEARRGPDREVEPDVLEPLDDLRRIADQKTAKDASIPNGSSIALLIEHRGASAVLGADAFGGVLGAGLHGLAQARGRDAVQVDAFKLPHHGSQGNVLSPLLAAAPASHYLVSSNGDIFHHPDDAALARVVLGAPPGPTLWFNYRNPRTERWADPQLVKRHGHSTVFPDPARPEGGAVLELPARP